MAGVRFLAIAVGAAYGSTTEVQQDVEWHGVENQVSILAQSARAQNQSLGSLGVALISSMGTTAPNPKPFEGGPLLFWKLQAEAFLATSGLPFAVIKPCGLADGAVGAARLVAGHDDYLLTAPAHKVNGVSAIARADVARVLLRALTTGAWRLASLRFDLCAATTGAPTAPTADALDHVLTSAQWPWAR